jgi:alkaline phosphatase D
MLQNKSCDTKDFDNEPVGNMVAVGAVEARSARLWMRTERPGALTVVWWPEDHANTTAQGNICIPEVNTRDNTFSVQIPEDFPPAPALSPLRSYGFRIMHQASGACIGSGHFETSPASPEETPERFALALMSCHQPFDENGGLTTQSEDMLRATYQCLQAHNTKLVFTVGDQMYSDQPHTRSFFNETYFSTVAPPGRQSLTECTAEEVRQLYQRRYRHFWHVPAWQALHATFPCYPIIDDHEIVDNWGTNPDHHTPPWQAVGQGARAAYMDYQGSRVSAWSETLSESFHYTVSYGNLGIFVMDLRSTRTAWNGGQLFAQDQENALRRFLHEQRNMPCLCIVLSVPVIHLPQTPVRLLGHVAHWHEDFADRWGTGAHRRDRDRFLHWLVAHQRQNPTQRIVLLGGDIHIGCVHEVRWESQGPVLYQMISSGITNDIGALMQRLSTFIIRLNRHMTTDDGSLRAKVNLLKGVDRTRQNPYGGLNVGILEIDTPTPGAPPQLCFYLYSHRGAEPVCVYRSVVV